MSTDNDKLTLDEALDTLQRERRERKSAVLERARAALAAAREDIAGGLAIDENAIRELERSIAEFEKYTLERPGLPPK